jgi:hypothetical protein
MLPTSEAAQALDELVRERRAAGVEPVGLNEVQAALFLGSLAEIRGLPEVRLVTVPAQRSAPPLKITVPKPRLGKLLRPARTIAS